MVVTMSASSSLPDYTFAATLKTCDWFVPGVWMFYEGESTQECHPDAIK